MPNKALRTRLDALPIGILLTVAFIGATEVVHHALHQQTLGVILFLLTLAPIAYTGLRGGLLRGVIAASLLALYTIHYAAPHGFWAELTPESLTNAGVVLVAGLGLTYPMSRIKVRSDAMRLALEARNADLERRNRELTEANATLESFGYVVSHDLKEPVRAIENYLHAAREAWPAKESRTFLESAHAANDKLARLLQGLLDYSRTSTLPTLPRDLSLADVIAGDVCRTRYERALQERGGQLVVDPALPGVLGDEVVLGQLLGNVILNAIRHGSRDGAHVVVRAAPSLTRMVHIVVEDNGAGFPPEVLSSFSQLGSSRASTIKGGFGLVIAQRAAQRLGAKMWLDNVPDGAGARVHIELLPATSTTVPVTQPHPLVTR